jgi:hypothetical protein
MQSMYFDNFLTEKECEHWINFIKNLNQDELNSDIKHNVMDSELSNSFAKRYIKDAKGSGRVTFVQYGENSKGLGRHKDFIGEKNVTKTCIIYLNENSGNLILYSLENCSKKEIEPKSGRLVVFDIDVEHEALPPKGKKYAIIFRI